jgi:hypothetical protein
VDLASGEGPKFARLLGGGGETRGIRTDVLVYELEAYLKEIDTNIPVPDTISDNLLQHLVAAWGKMQPRSFRRAPAGGTIKVAVGLRATHYLLSGGVDIAEQVASTDALLRREINPFLNENNDPVRGQPKSGGDVWDNAFDLRVRMPINPNIRDPERILLNGKRDAPKPARAAGEHDKDSPSFRYYDTQALDTSPGGFRIFWREPMPAGVQTGELLAIREAQDSRWCVAVIRWIQQDGASTSMGIELLAPRAIPVAARVIMKRGGPTDFTRALLLPELKPINQPATLITPRLPFAEDQKVHIQRQGIQSTAQLQRCLLKTDSFNQFTFRMLDGYLENAQINLNIANLSELIGDQQPDEPQ